MYDIIKSKEKEVVFIICSNHYPADGTLKLVFAQVYYMHLFKEKIPKLYIGFEGNHGRVACENLYVYCKYGSYTHVYYNELIYDHMYYRGGVFKQ